MRSRADDGRQRPAGCRARAELSEWSDCVRGIGADPPGLRRGLVRTLLKTRQRVAGWPSGGWHAGGRRWAGAQAVDQQRDHPPWVLGVGARPWSA